MKSLHLFGTPLRLEMRDGDNPFAKKRKRGNPKKGQKKRTGKAGEKTRGNADKQKHHVNDEKPPRVPGKSRHR